MIGSVACRHLKESLSDYIDGDLSDNLCAELERHLSECENCRIVVDTMRKTVELYHANSAAEGATLPNDVRKRLFYCLNLEDFVEDR